MTIPVRPLVDCIGGEWLIRFEAQQDARFATLTLSDRHKVTSRLIRVPRAFGGPADLYFQAVAKSGPRPTRIVERDQNGRALGALSITLPVKCDHPR